MFFLNMKTPGIEVRPIKQANGQGHLQRGLLHRRARPRRAAPQAQRGGGWRVCSLTTLMQRRRFSDRRGHFDRISTVVRVLLSDRDRGRPTGRRRPGGARQARDLGLPGQSGVGDTPRASRDLGSCRGARDARSGELSIGKLVAGSTTQEIAMFFALDLQAQA